MPHGPDMSQAHGHIISEKGEQCLVHLASRLCALGLGLDGESSQVSAGDVKGPSLVPAVNITPGPLSSQSGRHSE